MDADGFIDSSKAGGGRGASMEQVHLEMGANDPLQSQVPAHVSAQISNVAFKGTALFCYLLGGTIGLPFVFNFVIIVLGLAFDFWVVKNITGRLLVGLRWWHEVQADGSDNWIFESKSATRLVHPFDAKVFWTCLYVTPCIWALLAVLALFSVTTYPYIPVIIMGLGLSGANLLGYWRCERDAKKKLQSFLVQRLV